MILSNNIFIYNFFVRIIMLYLFFLLSFQCDGIRMIKIYRDKNIIVRTLCSYINKRPRKNDLKLSFKSHSSSPPFTIAFYIPRRNLRGIKGETESRRVL